MAHEFESSEWVTGRKWQAALTATQEFLRAVAVFLDSARDRDYLAAKTADFQLFTRAASIGAIIFMACSLWFDYAVASDIGWWTYLYMAEQELFLLAWSIRAWRKLDSRVLRIWSVLTPLAIAACELGRLGLLAEGATYGMGVFVFFFIFIPILLISQPLWVPILALFLVTVFPMAVAPIGLGPDFDWAVYDAYMWLGMAPVVLLLFMFEYLYQSVFRQRRALAAEAATDTLTRVANRGHFLAEAIRNLAFHARKRRPIALLFIDIDYFKQINDTHGHNLGDDALIKTVAALEYTKREEDLIGRYGGDEIVVLLPETTIESASAAAERMHQAVAGITLETEYGQRVGLTVSIGVAGLGSPREDGVTDIDQLIHLADLALYQVKQAGRNGVACRGPAHLPTNAATGGRRGWRRDVPPGNAPA